MSSLLLQHLLTQIYNESPTASRITVTHHVNSSLGLKSSHARDVWERCPSPDNESVAHKSETEGKGRVSEDIMSFAFVSVFVFSPLL